PTVHLFPYTTLFRSAQIVGCLLQDADSQTPLGRRRCRFGWRSNKMRALSIAGFGIQKRGELLARHSRQGFLRRVFAPETVRKHRSEEHTSELQSRVD